MDAEVFLTYSSVSKTDVQGRTVVVIDVLRACSTIVTALSRGARAVFPVSDMAEAGRIAGNLDPDVYRLGGERDGEKIDGYHLGNSPLAYTREEVEGRDVILNTTNGTRALSRSADANHLVGACFLNAGPVAKFVRTVDDAVTIVCAGRDNRLALEDTLCAGLLLDRLWHDQEPHVMTDSAHTAYTLYDSDRDRLGHALRKTNHAEWLRDQGLEDDLDYCLQLDECPILPYYTDNRLVDHQEPTSQK